MATNSHSSAEEDRPRHVGEPGMVGLDHPTVVPDTEADNEHAEE